MNEENITRLIKKEVENLRNENKKLKDRITRLEREIPVSSQSEENTPDEQMSRRSFLRKAGLGTAGLAAMALSPATALDIRSDQLQFYNSSSSTLPLLEVDTNGYVDIDKLFVNAVYETESDLPNTAPEGSQAYIKSTNSIYIYGA